MRYLSFSMAILALLSIPITGFCQRIPINPARSISFTTNEGSFMDVDVSPDGKKLVFDLLGDLYSMSSWGGQAKQLTKGIALNTRPSWSPDGKKIAFVSDATGSFELHVVDFAGTYDKTLGKQDQSFLYDHDVIWTPEGNNVLFDNRKYEVSTGTIEKTGVQNPLAFSPDGRFIYRLDRGKIFRYDNKLHTETNLSPVLRGLRNIAISPNGYWCAWVSEWKDTRSLIALYLPNNTQRVLIGSLLKTDSTYLPPVSPHFSFAPDSRHIFIGFGGKIHKINVESGTDEIIPFTAHVQSKLGPLNYHTFSVSENPFKVKYARSANASPDGKHLVFSTLGKIYTMNLPDGEPRVLTPLAIGQFQPIYSPDGKWIAYVSWSDKSGGQLWRVHSSGGTPELLSRVAGQYQRPAWSPDGRLIAVVRGIPVLLDRDDPGRGQLLLIPLNGGATRVIDEEIPLWNQISFSVDGNRVIYEPKNLFNGNGPQLVSKDTSGKDLRILATGTTRFSSANFQQRTLSPDGRYIVYSLAEDLYLMPVDQSKDPTLLFDQDKKLPVVRFGTGVDPIWEKGGKCLSWTYGNHFYRIDPEKIIKATKQRNKTTAPSSFPDTEIVSIKVKPDQTVPLDLTIPSFHAKGTMALKNVRIITMKGNQVIARGTILIKDGRFAAVGPYTKISIPKSAKVLDLKGATIMPGIIDLHSHMRVSPDVFPQESWMYLANLAYGVTTVRDPSLSFDSFGYAELLKSGQMTGPRLFTVGRSINPFWNTQLNNLSDALSIAKKRAKMGGIAIKQYTLPTRIQKQWLLMASNQYGLNMTNEGDYDPIIQLGMYKDGSTGIEHNPVWGDVYNDMITFVARSGTYLTPTLQVCYGKEEGKEYFNYKYWRNLDVKLRRFTPENKLKEIMDAHSTDTLRPGFLSPARIDARIRHAGGNIGLGSHGENQGIGVHNELWALQMGGLTNMESLQAATIVGAKALGIQRDLGSIEKGKIADLIILNKNPLDDIHNSREIRYVMKDGVLYDGNTLDEIWPVKKKCPDWRFKQNLNQIK